MLHFAIALIILLKLMILPLLWGDEAPFIFGFPAFVVQKINAIIAVINWLIDKIFN